MRKVSIEFNEDGTFTVELETEAKAAAPMAPAPGMPGQPEMGGAPAVPGNAGNPGMQPGNPEMETKEENEQETSFTFPTLKAAFTAIAEFAENGQMTDHEGQAASFEDGFNTRGA